jgi:hypothetical protein
MSPLTSWPVGSSIEIARIVTALFEPFETITCTSIVFGFAPPTDARIGFGDDTNA